MAQNCRDSFSPSFALLVILAVVFSVASSQETFSQRRTKYLEEKRRLEADKKRAEEVRLGIPPTIITTTTTTTPKPYHELTPSEKLDVAGRNIAKGDEAEFMAKLSQHINWEQFLTPIPVSLGVLGSLMMAATQTSDFAIDDHQPVGGFHYMRHPTSFRQSLMQIGHESYKAFLVAHGNMNKIRLSTRNIPSYMKEATRILATGNFTVIQSSLHRPLQVVRNAIRDSLTWSVKVAIQFEYLSNLTDEVHLASISTKSSKERTRLSVIEQQSHKNLTRDSIQQQLNQIGKQLKDDLERSDRVHQDLLQAWLSKPTALESFGMDIGQFFINDVVGGFLSIFSSTGSSKKSSNINEANNSGSNSSYIDPHICIFNHSSLVFEIDATGQKIASKYPTLKSINSASNGQYNATADSNYLKSVLKNVTECQPIIDVIVMGQNYIERMHNLAHKKSSNFTSNSSASGRETHFEEERTEEFSRINELGKNFTRQCQHLKEIAQHVPSTNIPPVLSSEIPNESRASRQEMAMANYKIKLHTKSLQVLRNALDNNWKLSINKTEESIRILQELYVLKTEQVQYEEAIEMLQIGLTQLSDLKENWSNLVRFFVSISSVIDSISNKHIEDFNKDIETTSQSLRNIHKIYVINAIHAKTTRANQATALVHGMADIYYKISTKYLMPNVQKLDRLMGLQTDQIPNERQVLLKSCERDSIEIGRLIVDGRLKVIEEVAARVRQVKNEYKFLDDLRERAKEEERTKIVEEKNKLVLSGQIPAEELQTQVEEEVKNAIESDIFLSQDPIDELEF